MDQPNPTTTEILTGESPAKAIQALHRANLIHEAHASCSLDGGTQSEGDSYVLISEDRLKRYESEVRRLKDELQHNRVAFDERKKQLLWPVWHCGTWRKFCNCDPNSPNCGRRCGGWKGAP
jgi:hypothetical protein